MLVIVSPKTITSLWVPFEIGYGFEKTELAVLCLKGIPKGSLPEYIRTVKVVRDIDDLNSLIATLTKQSIQSLIEKKAFSAYNDKQNTLNSTMDNIISDRY